MKTKITFLSLGLLFLSFNLLAQKTSKLVVFSENGERFFLTVNGAQQNQEASTQVTADNLTGDFHRVSVQFEDNSLGTASQNFALDPGMEQKAVVKLRRNGSYAIRPFGEPTPLMAQKVEAPESIAPAPSAPAQMPEKVEHRHDGGTVSTTTTTTTRSNSGGGENIRMEVGVGDVGIDVRVAVNDGGVHSNTQTNTTITETRTASAQNVEPAPAPAVTEEVVRCAPMEPSAFNKAKSSISGKSFADDKKTTARQILRSNCMSTDQIIEVMGLFSFEDDKLDFAKMAYERCSDAENYWKLNDAFTFSASIEELDEYLQGK